MKFGAQTICASLIFFLGVIAGSDATLSQNSITTESWAIYPLNEEINSVRLPNNLYEVQDNTMLLSKEAFNGDKWTANTVFVGSSMSFWYTKQAPSSSLDMWNGLMIVVRNGLVSGFLNDGTDLFNPHHDLEKSFFIPCSIPTRQEGKVNVLSVSYQNGFFRIKLNDRHCFQTDQITMFEDDKEYLYFGISHGTFADFNVKDDIVPPVDEVIPELEEQLQKQADETKLNQQKVKQETRNRGFFSTDSNFNTELLKQVLNRLDQYSDFYSLGGSDNQLIDDLKRDLSNLRNKQASGFVALAQKIATISDIFDQISPSSSSINMGDNLNDYFSVEQGIELLTIRLNSIESAFKKNHGEFKSEVTTALNLSSGSKKRSWAGPVITLLVAEILLVVIYSAFRNKYIKGNRADYHAKMI
jgi:hypothetical protein